mmetsp:Transcript_63326/g.177196  ORF Transcript_63326/g.177196 Transcript_63326/m.177196 type:complete len:99 (+) Transcript_63326:575-871(+)
MSCQQLCSCLGRIVEQLMKLPTLNVRAGDVIVATPDHVLFSEGKKMIQRPQQSLFSRYLSKFAECLLIDHQGDLASFVQCNPNFSRNKDYVCKPRDAN